MQKALQYLKRQILVPGLHIRKIGTLKRTCVYCVCDLKSEQLEMNVVSEKLYLK